MAIPSPEERPDLYDDFDCRPGRIRSEAEQAELDAVTPDHLKALRAERQAQKQKPQPAHEPAD